MAFVVVVPLSGGWDSTNCLIQALSDGFKEHFLPIVMHVDYGQPYRMAEWTACQQIMASLKKDKGIQKKVDVNRWLFERVWASSKLDNVSGVFPGRNEMILRLAKDKYGADRIYFGTRNLLRVFDHYGDSSYQWGKDMEKKLRVEIRMPCVLVPKMLIKLRVRLQVPEENIYSTEKRRFI